MESCNLLVSFVPGSWEDTLEVHMRTHTCLEVEHTPWLHSPMVKADS